MEGQITMLEWQQWKEDIRKKLQEAAGNFVYIGYRLKQIKESKAYEQENYEDIFAFAWKEYGLSKSVTSRFIAINERFGEGIALKEEYQNIGSSKLSEMLTLSDTDILLITEQTTVKDIREIKKFNKEEIKEREEGEERVHTALEKCIIDFFKGKEKKELLDSVIRIMVEEVVSEAREKSICDEINPTGFGNHKKGIIFLFFYGYEQGVKYKKMGEVEVTTIPYLEFNQQIFEIYKEYIGENLGVWENFYGSIVEEKKEERKIEESKENTSVATSQREVKKEEKEAKIEEEEEEEEEETEETEETEEKEEKEEIEDDLEDEEAIGDEAAIKDNTVAAVMESEKEIENVTESAEIVEEEPVQSLETDREEELKENAIEYADIYIKGNLTEWEAQDMPMEEVEKLIRNTKQLVAILELLRKEVERKESIE